MPLFSCYRSEKYEFSVFEIRYNMHALAYIYIRWLGHSRVFFVVVAYLHFIRYYNHVDG